MPKAQAIPRPWSRPATQLAEIMAKVALELEARSDQGPSGDLNRNSIQEACRAQRDATAWLGLEDSNSEMSSQNMPLKCRMPGSSRIPATETIRVRAAALGTRSSGPGF